MASSLYFCLGQVHKPKYQRDRPDDAKYWYPNIEGMGAIVNVDYHSSQDGCEGRYPMANVETVMIDRGDLVDRWFCAG